MIKQINNKLIIIICIILVIILGVVERNAYQNYIQEQREKLDKKAMAKILCVDVLEMNNSYVVEYEIYSPIYVQRLKNWEQYGLLVLVDGKDKEWLEKLATDIGYKEDTFCYRDKFNDMRMKAKVTEYLDVLLYGTEATGSEISIMEMDMEALVKCIRLIGDAGEINCIELIRE